MPGNNVGCEGTKKVYIYSRYRLWINCQFFDLKKQSLNFYLIAYVYSGKFCEYCKFLYREIQ